MADQPQPQEVDYIIQSLLDDVQTAVAEKAAYLGKYKVTERTNRLLVQENQGLRQKLEKYEKAEAGEPQAAPTPKRKAGESKDDSSQESLDGAEKPAGGKP